MYTQVFSLILLVLGPLGIIILLLLTTYILRYYQGSNMGSFRWHLKNARLKDLSALATLFCFAMAASYAVLQESWSILYVILAVKVGTWWLRFVMSERS